MRKTGSLENVGEVTSLGRREFVTGVGLAVLSVQVLPLLAHAESAASMQGGPDAHDLVVHSGAGAFGHVHDLYVPRAMLDNPPREGVELTSTKALLHTHKIGLTQTDLETVSGGGTVTKKSSSHRFVITLVRR